MKLKRIVILLLVLFIPFFCYAEECNKNDIKIESIELSDIRGNAEELSSSNNNNNKINLNTKMNVIGDSITYKIVIKNTSKSDYTFDKNSITKDYLSYDITYEDNSNIIKPNEEKVIYLRLSYDNKPEVESLVNGVLKKNNEISFNLTKETSFINPETGNKILLSLIYLLIPVIISFYLIKKKKTTFIVLLVLTIIPHIVNATCVTSIDINLDLEIDRKDAIFLPGAEVNIKMKQLAGDNATTISFQDQNIIAIKKSELEPIESNKEEKNIVSMPNSLYPIYMWYEDGAIYWWSEDATPSLNETTQSMFNNFSKLNDISGLEPFDSSNTTNMRGLFIRATSLPSIEILEKWNTSNVTEMSYAFYNSPIISLSGLENWDTSNVTNMSGIFQYCKQLKDVDAIKNWNTSNVLNMSFIFDSCFAIEEVDLSNWDTSNVINMWSTFGMWTDNGRPTTESNLKRVKLSKKFNTSNVTNFSGFLANNANIEDYSFLKYLDTSKATSLYTFLQNNFNFTDGDLQYIKDYDISNVTNLEYAFFKTSITTVNPLRNWNTSKLETTKFAFSTTPLESLNGLENWDVSNVTNMNSMFNGNKHLSDVSAINDWNITKVTNFEEMMKGVPTHPEFSKVPGTWSNGTFTPTP